MRDECTCTTMSAMQVFTVANITWNANGCRFANGAFFTVSFAAVQNSRGNGAESAAIRRGRGSRWVFDAARERRSKIMLIVDDERDDRDLLKRNWRT